MEIIKKGTPPEEKIYEAECSKCKSVLRFKQSEGKITYDQRDGNLITVKCPVCGESVHKNIAG